MKLHAWTGLFGLLLGFALGGLGFADGEQIRAMLTFADPRLLFAFAGALPLCALGYWLLGRGRLLDRRPIHPGTVPGGLLFGAGWALTGACPAVPLIQLGQGQLPAAATLAGLVIGVALYPVVHKRFFRWDPGSCG
ncbi:MAG TPA: YeeE/YedE thiosulfate transporter family protein [Myxococcota bacterium]|nr:YeeE/YedE thiosulfate transporter family protein [Myxococcota bacterium]HRY94333.1 YeeE/YedE thiosulfate transporter family protein [Myxococcota bacterium]HSA21214.1 YeeE/YedE thiosulfate transporter family protein [Myxococcota bacterium]